jgi:hypothetical protein
MLETYNSSFEYIEALRLRFDKFRRSVRAARDCWKSCGVRPKRSLGRRGMNVVARSFAPRCKQLEEVDGTRRESAGDKTQRGETRNCAGLRGVICPGCGRPAGNCMLEVESPQDAKVRLEWKGASSSELTQLIRAFSVKPLFRRFCGRRLPERLLAYIIEDATLIKVPAEKVTRIHVRFKAGRQRRLRL